MSHNTRYLSVFFLFLTALRAIDAEEVVLVQYKRPVQLGVIEDESIDESSGLARSHTRPGAFWTHNDSGDRPRLFLIDGKGRTLATFRVRGAKATDWEDMCSYQIDGSSYLAVGDIGDNARKRSSVQIYLIKEPRFNGDAPADGELNVVRTITCKYETGPTDCESIAFDPHERTILLMSKRLGLRSAVFEVPLADESEKVTARVIATVGVPAPTSMDISVDGRRAIVLTYGNGFEFTRRATESWSDAFERAPRGITMPTRRQGEAICYGADDRSLYLTSEKTSQPFWKIPSVTTADPSGSP